MCSNPREHPPAVLILREIRERHSVSAFHMPFSLPKCPSLSDLSGKPLLILEDSAQSGPSSPTSLVDELTTS